MKRIAALLLLGSLLIPVLGQTTERQQVSTEILSATPQRTSLIVHFDPAAAAAKITELQHGTQARPSDGFSSVLAISGTGTPQVNVLNCEVGEIVSRTAALDEAGIPDRIGNLAVVSRPAIIHGLRVAAVNYSPIIRDGNGNVRAVTKLEVEVTTSGGGGENETYEPVRFSSAFEPFYRATVDNLDELYPERSLEPPGRYMVLGPTRTIETDLPPIEQWQNWLDLKVRKGYTMQIVSLGMIEDAGYATTPNGIRSFIHDSYHNDALPPLEYVMIIGDALGGLEFPSFEEDNPEHSTERSYGDNDFYTVDGDDYFPDIFNGRLSGQTIVEVITYLHKVYLYETDPYKDDMSWFESATYVAGNYDDGSSITVTPVWNMEWARQYMTRYGCISDADSFYWKDAPGYETASWYTPFIRQDIEDGVSLVLYRGWAGSQRWQYPEFRIDDVRDMSLGKKNPAIFAIVCGSGNFAFQSGQCLGEIWTSGVGSPNQPNGGIVFFGATDLHTNTRHNNALLATMVRTMRVDGLRSTGPLALAGKMEIWRQFPYERDPEGDNAFVRYYGFHVYNILGDPETQLTVFTPSEFWIDYPESLNPGETTLGVVVYSDGAPVENAVVTARSGEDGEVAATLTGASGHAALPVELTDGIPLQLTVWRDGRFMRLIDIPVQGADFDPKITEVNWSAGTDGAPNPGETVDFTLTVQNLGTSAATYTADITAADPNLTVLTGTATFSEIAPGASGTSTSFSLAISDELEDGNEPSIIIEFTDGQQSAERRMTVPVSAPDPVIDALNVGDGNGILDPGETRTITIDITNNGSTDAENLTATVSSWDNAVSFVSNSAGWGAVPTQQSASSNPSIEVTCDAGATPGRQVMLRFEFFDGGNRIARKTQALSIGVVDENDPTGPDEYGYYAYDESDAGFTATPTYNWVELDGHAQSVAHDVHDDTFFELELPEPFTFYGTAFDSVWICSNGWISFEETDIAEFRNWEMPSPIGAPSMVCPFWDDLVGDHLLPNDDTLHYVWTLDDAANDRFIIQWKTFNRRGLNDVGNEAYCWFQCILEFTDLGDGSIVFQYNLISDVDNRDNFSTVGIQDSDHERGLTLLYALHYAETVSELAAERAIRITTTPPDGFQDAGDNAPQGTVPTAFALHAPYPNPFNPAAALRFDVPHAAPVTLKVYDVLGREAAVLADGMRAAGSYTVTFDGRDLASGLYFARLTSSGFTQTQKLMLVK